MMQSNDSAADPAKTERVSINSPKPTLAAGAMITARYRIDALLGHGGGGAVYRAWDLSLNRPCALKENFDTSAEGAQQFMREAQMLARLSHTNLPGVTDYFTIAGQGQYLVMDFVEGEDLEVILARTGQPISETEARGWIIQICDALTYLHSRRDPIIHRDIKPANIKITPSGTAVLVDFGIAKIYDPSTRTTHAAQAVTPGYSPPEQYGQGSTDPRSDIYALAATLYTLLTNRVPPASVDIMSGAALALQPVNSFNPTVSPNVSMAIGRATQISITQRHPTAEAFKVALLQTPGFGADTVVCPSCRFVNQAGRIYCHPMCDAAGW